MISKLLDSVKSGSAEVIKLMIERGEVTPQTRLQVGLRRFLAPLISLVLS